MKCVAVPVTLSSVESLLDTNEASCLSVGASTMTIRSYAPLMR